MGPVRAKGIRLDAFAVSAIIIEGTRVTTMWILVKSLVFTILVPGTVTVVLPYYLLSRPSEFQIGVFRFVGVLPLVIGLATYLRCAWDFARLGQGTPAPIDPPKSLVTRGLYLYVRNPMYVGVVLILVGETLFLQSWTLAAYTVLVWTVFNLFVVLIEEPKLRRKFGADYVEYCRTVPRWIPGVGRSGSSA